MSKVKTSNTTPNWQIILDSSPVTAIVVNQDREIIYSSKGIKLLLGYAQDEIEGRKFCDFFINNEGNNVFEVSYEFPKGPLSLKNKSGKTVHCIYQHVFDATSNTIIIYLSESDEIVHLRQQHEDLIDLMQGIIDNAPMMIFIKDAKKRYRMLNHRMLDAMGKTYDQVIGKTDLELGIDNQKLEAYRAADDQVLHDGELVTFDDVVTKDNQQLFYQVTKLPLKGKNGKVKFICVIVTDVTAFKNIEKKLTHAKDEAENAKESQELFLANISHEIRTPMNGIMGMTNLLLETNLDKLQKEYTESIRVSANSLLNLVNDLLDVSKIRAGKFQLEQIDFNLNETLQRVIFPLQHKATEKSISLELILDDKKNIQLKGDPLRLQQIIINLVNNAIKFTHKGGVKIIVNTEHKNDQKLKLLVQIVDTGIGIPKNKIDSIFELYTQSENNTARLYGGTGLGLNIVKQLTDLQGGTVNVASEEGKGSTFSFEITYDISIPEQPKETKTENKQTTTAWKENMRILIADDNPINVKVARYVLEKWSVDIDEATDGQEALDKLKDGQFDVVLMDMQMPNMDGFEAIHEIRNVIKSKIPIIAMTANALKGEAEKCIEAGANAYISKPFDQEELYQEISKLTSVKAINNSKNKKTTMQQDLVDFSYVEDLAGNKPEYMKQVLTIFMENTYPGVDVLKKLIDEKADFEPISKQAHFLKSSVGIIKIKDMYETLKQIEMLGKEKKDREEIERLLEIVLKTFGEAKKIILAKMK